MPYGPDLYCTVAAVTAPELALTFDANEAAPLDSELLAEFVSDASTSVAAQPSLGAAPGLGIVQPQVVGIEIVVNGTAMNLGDLQGWSVTRGLHQQLQTWQISIPLADATGPLGSPWNVDGPPTGKRTVTINGLYQTATGLHRIPLIKDGIADTSERSSSGAGVDENLDGVDAGGRYDRKVVTLVLPPGHGLPRGRVIRQLAEEAGITLTALDDGHAMAKELQVVNGAWLGVASELAEVEGRAILWDRSGQLTNPKASRPGDDEPIRWTFAEADVAEDSGVRVRHKADVLTDVTVTTQQQLTKAVGECDARTDTTTTTSRGPYTPESGAYQQTPGGYSANGPNQAQPDDGMTGLTVVEQLSKCGKVVRERTSRWAWRRFQVARYQYDLGLDAWDKLKCFTDDNTDAAEPGYSDGEKFVLVEVVESWHFYNLLGLLPSYPIPELHAGFTLLSVWGDAKPVYHARPDYDSVPTGEYIGTVTRTTAPKCPLSPTQSRATTADPFVGIDNRQVLGGGDGVVADAELMRLVQIESRCVRDEIGSGTITREDKASAAFAVVTRPTGLGLYRFADGRETDTDVAETLMIVAREQVFYFPTGEASHTRLTNSTDALTGVQGSVVETGQEGIGPALDRIDLPERPVYADAAEEAAFATDAKRSDTRTLKVQVISETLELDHEKNELKTDSTWAEDEEELERIAKRLIEDDAAAEVTMELAACNFYVEPGQRHHWIDHRIGLDCSRVRLLSVTWSGSPGGWINTTMQGKAYGW